MALACVGDKRGLAQEDLSNQLQQPGWVPPESMCWSQCGNMGRLDLAGDA